MKTKLGRYLAYQHLVIAELLIAKGREDLARELTRRLDAIIAEKNSSGN